MYAIRSYYDACQLGREEKELNFVRHTAIKGISEDAEKFQFNTSVARLMEFVNALYKYDTVEEKNLTFLTESIKDLLLLISPFAPHFAEEMWEKLGYEYSIFNQQWPVFDEKALIKDTVEIAVQVNGAVRYKVEIPSAADNKQIEA